MISVIIPIYNRKDNLRLVLAALDRQSFKDFEVVVSDDGSSDNPVQVLFEFDTRLRLRYCWHQHRGYRLCKVRNDGARFANGHGFLFMDSDVMLNPFALEHYRNILDANPDALIAGRYDWLPPMEITLHDVYMNWEAIVAEELPKREVSEIVGLQGPDPRHVMNPRIFNSSEPRDKYCLSIYGGNQLIPKHIYWALEGYDERMTGHGGEDAEFGMRAQKAGIKCIFADEVVGYHIYHYRDQRRNEREVRKNIEYIATKHDLKELGIRHGRENEMPITYSAEVEGYV